VYMYFSNIYSIIKNPQKTKKWKMPARSRSMKGVMIFIEQDLIPKKDKGA
jgi:hypothetical protein